MAYRLPMFPLSTVLFPSGQLSLHVFEARYRKMTVDCLAGSGEFGVVLISRGSEVGGGDQRVMMGSVAGIEHAHRLADGRWLLIADGRRRIRVEEWLPDDPYPVALVSDVDDWEPPRSAPDKDWSGENADMVDLALQMATAMAANRAVERARALLSELDRPVPPPAGHLEVEDPDDGGRREPEPGEPGWLTMVSWQLCAMAPLTPLDAQSLLEERDPRDRLVDLTELMEDAGDDLVRLLAGG